MTDRAVLTVPIPVVACGDVLRGHITWPTDAVPTSVIVELRAQVDSAVPGEVVVASQTVHVHHDADVAFSLSVPPDGPITARGRTMAVSWAVTVVSPGHGVVATAPVVVMPRGGVALWLQRHAPPPAPSN